MFLERGFHLINHLFFNRFFHGYLFLWHLFTHCNFSFKYRFRVFLFFDDLCLDRLFFISLDRLFFNPLGRLFFNPLGRLFGGDLYRLLCTFQRGLRPFSFYRNLCFHRLGLGCRFHFFDLDGLFSAANYSRLYAFFFDDFR